MQKRRRRAKTAAVGLCSPWRPPLVGHHSSEELRMQLDEFRNEQFTDFSKEENVRAMRDALAQVAAELGREYPLVIGGERIKTGRTFDSTNPAKKTEVVGRFQKATEELARAAVEKANEAFRSWRNTLAQERADLLFRV